MNIYMGQWAGNILIQLFIRFDNVGNFLTSQKLFSQNFSTLIYTVIGTVSSNRVISAGNLTRDTNVLHIGT